MSRKTTIATGVALGVAVLAGSGVALGVAQGDDDNEEDVPISGAELADASAAALAFTGEGRVTGTEVGDEDSYYEVEVTLEDGSHVDVQLDRAFHVVGRDADRDDGADED